MIERGEPLICAGWTVAVRPTLGPAQHAGHPAGPHDGRHRGLHDSATITQQDDVRREHVEQVLQIARFDRPLERLERAAGLGRGNAPRGRRAATCARARWATWRTAAGVLPTASAISS